VRPKASKASLICRTCAEWCKMCSQCNLY